MSAAAATAPADDDALVFEWDRPVYSRWRLALMLLLSFLAHAASFYVLQVAYTPTGSLLPPPAQAMLVPPDSPQNVALGHWIDMADPALMTQPRPLSVDEALGTIGFHYVPSYATVLQAFKPLPTPVPAATPPRTRKPGPVPAGLLPPLEVPADWSATLHASQPAAAATVTRVMLSANVRALLAPAELAPVPPPINRAAKPLERTVFLLGVPATGGAAWIFQAASSGDNAEKGADAAARDYLARLRFRPPAERGAPDPVWGWATFDWGREAYP